MAHILFLVGLVLLILGKLRIGSFEVQGPQVRAAGFMLMFPVLMTLLLGFVLGLLSGGDEVALANGVAFVTFLQIAAMLICSVVAYKLLTTPTSGEDIETGERDETPESAPAQQPRPKRPFIDSLPRPNFPTVMSTAEAARYLEVSEQAVLDLIDEGKLAAARINYRYQISRSVLDDFLRRQAGSSAE